MDMLRTPFAPAVEDHWLDQLRSQIHGSVIAPEDAQYDDVRQPWNLSVEHRPALVVVPERASDIATAVRFASAEGLRIAIQATGHGAARPADEHTLLINTARMTRVRVNAEAQTAWVEAGAKWKVVLEAAQAVGLAPLLGSTPDVGAVGYTLGGGMGWLARKYGLSLDSVNWFELVTPAGRLVRASESENPDLFWALRGGGGNFGVVTGMEIRLYPVKTIYGGNLIYPAALAKDVLARFREWIKSNPDELTSSVVLMNLPPIPDVPEFLRGQSVMMVRGGYVGAAEAGAARIQEWLDWKTPIANTWHEMPFSEVATISNDPEKPTPSTVNGLWVRELTDEAIETLVHYMFPENGRSPLVFTEIRHTGGAISRVERDANAFSNRDAQLVLEMLGVTPTKEAYQIVKDYMDEYKRALQPALTGKVYLNFNGGDALRQRSADGFSEEHYQRLQAIKARYDAENRFDHSFTIPPVTPEHPNN